jgi:hypothetical protein
MIIKNKINQDKSLKEKFLDIAEQKFDVEMTGRELALMSIIFGSITGSLEDSERETTSKIYYELINFSEVLKNISTELYTSNNHEFLEGTRIHINGYIEDYL